MFPYNCSKRENTSISDFRSIQTLHFLSVYISKFTKRIVLIIIVCINFKPSYYPTTDKYVVKYRI